jgi:hypothetical protein
MRRALDVLWFLAIALCPLHVRALTLEVAPDAQVAAEPKAATVTLAAAIARVEALSQGAWPAEGVLVRLRAGVYRVAAPVRLGARASGRVNAPLVFKGPEQGAAVISGARELDGFVKDLPAGALSRLPDSARAHVLSVILPRVGVTDFGRFVRQGQGREAQPAPLELFYRGAPMRLAQWPNRGYVPIDAVASPGAGDKLSLGQGNAAAWATEPDLWMTGYWGQDWADEWIAVTAVEVHTRTLTLRDGPPLYGAKAGQRVKIVNALSELDEPGEWYLDRTDGSLMFWPPGPLATGDAEVSMLDQLLLVDGASHVHFDGIDFEGARGDAVVVSGGRDVRLVRARMRNIGGRAVRLSGTAHQVLDCDIQDTGQGGIVLWAGDRRTLVPALLVAQGNRIQRFNRWGKTYRPAIAIGGVGNTARGNLIAEGSHTGIVFHGNDHLIEFNELHSLALETGDVGAIYTGRDWTARGTFVRHNHLHDIKGPGLHGSRGVYLDDQASGITVQGNLFVRVDQPVVIGGGRDNLIDNNQFVASSPAVYIDARGRTWQRKETEDPDWALRKALRAVPYQKTPYSDRYPGLAQILERSPGAPVGNVVRRNVVIGGRSLLARDGAEAELEVERWFSGEAAPLVDSRAPADAREAVAFALRPDAPALREGFAPLPLARMACTGSRWARLPPGRLMPANCMAPQPR